MERKDEELLGELRNRFEESRIALANLRAMTKKLESLNEKLRQSEAMKSDFLSNIRNEINNPLTSIMGLAKQMLDRRTDEGASRAMAATIHREAFNLDFQLRNIFAAAELEAGEAAPDATLVDVAALVRGQIAAFGHKAEEKRAVVSFETAGELAFKTDPDKLQKVVANLLANAIEFNREGGKVRICATREGSRLHLTVADEGIGIPEDNRNKVFDRFIQLDSGMRKRHKGHGIGLSITKALVEMLGGAIAVASAPDKGCVFTVTIPELEPDRAVDAASSDGNEFLFEGGTQF